MSFLSFGFYRGRWPFGPKRDETPSQRKRERNGGKEERKVASGPSTARRRSDRFFLGHMRAATLALAAVALLIAFSAPPASAAAPAWRVLGAVGPTNLPPLGEGILAVYATNVGGAPTAGPTTLTIGPLPSGITTAGDADSDGDWSCSPKGAGISTVTCTLATSIGALKSPLPVRLPIQVGPSAAPESTVTVEVSGGGAAPDPASRNVYDVPITVSEEDAKPGIQAFWAEAWDTEGQTSVLAGAHPNAAGTMFLVNTVRVPSGFIKPAGDPRDVLVDLPPGFIGNPLVTDRCPNELAGSLCGLERESSVGEAIPVLQTFGTGAGAEAPRVFNDEPPRGYAAQFTFRLLEALGTAVASVRSDEDFGVRVHAPNIPTAYSIYGALFMLEGNPPGAGGQAFLTNPTSCAEQAQRPPITKFQMNSWQSPDVFDEQIADIAPVIGCEGLEFVPTFTFDPSSTQAATGVATTARVHLDQEGLLDPAKRATPHLKRSVVTLPEGVTLNPSAANGLQACSTAQVGYMGGGFPMPNPMRFNMNPVACPQASKIGAAQIETPLLEDPLQGTVYLAAQNDNPFGSLLAMYLVIEDEKTGTVVKLPGEVRPDPRTGQLTAIFDNNPQVPFTDLTLNFRGGGPRSTLATPDVCATYTTKGEFTPWSAPESGPPAQTADDFSVSSGPGGKPCPTSKAARPFAPQASAGTVAVQAGGHTPFVLNVNRADGEQEIKRIDIALPPGLTGKLAGIPYCSEFSITAAKARTGTAEQGLPSCPPASRIGTVRASAGVGNEPISVNGTAYLAGPYSGAPLSVVVITPAVAGPFDLGNVVIRTPLYVDPHTAQLRAISDEIPHILQGLPLQLRSLSIQMDRSNFTINPTSCKRMTVGVATTGAGGDPWNPADDVVHRQSVPFQVGGCNKLGFKPKLKLRFKGGTKRSQNPAIRAVLTQPPGQSNIARTAVILPRTAFIDQAHISNPCTRVQFAANACPPKSILGTAKAWSPLLDEPLKGNVYFRSNGGERELPDMVAVLKGQVDVELIGFIDAVPNKQGTSSVRNTFAIVPDAPVSRFELNLKGGDVGLVENSVNLCKVKKSRNRATVKLVAHSGKKKIYKPLIQNDCKKPGKGKGKGRGGKGR